MGDRQSCQAVTGQEMNHSTRYALIAIILMCSSVCCATATSLVATQLDALINCADRDDRGCSVDHDMANRLSMLMVHICREAKHEGLGSCGEVLKMKPAAASWQPRLLPLNLGIGPKLQASVMQPTHPIH